MGLSTEAWLERWLEGGGTIPGARSVAHRWCYHDERMGAGSVMDERVDGQPLCMNVGLRGAPADSGAEMVGQACSSEFRVLALCSNPASYA